MSPELKASEQLSSLFESLGDGRASLDALAKALSEHPGVILLADPADTARYLDELQRTLGPDLAGYGSISSQDVPTPQPLTVAGTDGRLSVLAFTSVDRAREYATANGIIASADVLPYSRQPWPAGLRLLVQNEVASVVIDEGSAHRTTLSREGLVQVSGVLDRPRVATLPTLYVVVRDRSIYVERLPDGQRCVFAYDEERLAIGAQENMAARGLAMAIEPRITEKLLRAMVDAGIGRLVVNQGWSDRREYDTPDLALMKEISAAPKVPSPVPLVDSATPDTGTPPADVAERIEHGAPEPVPELLRKARAQQAATVVPPPHEDDAASRAFFKSWQKKAAAGMGDVWQFLEALAYEGTLYVPRSPEPLSGLTWPQATHVFKQPDNVESTLVYLYSSESAARKALAEKPEALQDVVRLSGVEAFRWVFAHPMDVAEVAIDYGDADGWLSFPVFWLRDALFPFCHDLGDLSRVPRVALSRLGSLPGARGLKPEVMRGLVHGWRALLSVRPSQDGQFRRVSHQGRSYLPVFTDSEEFFAFQASQNGHRLVPEAAGNEPPFMQWLTAARDADGVLVNPCSKAPFVLDHAALVVMDLRCRSTRQPTPSDLMDAVKALEAQGAISLDAVASVVAELPAYWLGVAQLPSGGAAILHGPNDPETGVLFTSGERLQRHLDANRGHVEQQLLATGAEMRPVCRVSRWFASAPALMAEAFPNVTIDPRPDGSGGMRLDRRDMQRVLTALDARLCPRVPGFAWEA